MNILSSQQQLENVCYELSDICVALWSVIYQIDENGQPADFLINNGHSDLADRTTRVDAHRPAKVLIAG